MDKLPRIFRSLRKVVGRAPIEAGDAVAASRGELPTLDPNTIRRIESAVDVDFGDDQFAQLDRLYREALNAMESVESELSRTGDLLRTTSDDNADDIQTGIVPAENGAAVFRGPDKVGPPSDKVSSNSDTRVAPAQVIEAALFVGGTSLTIKRLCTLLKGEFDQHFVEDTIDALNNVYASENRPYEIRFGTGGYRMVLRESFEAVRNRVFGLGPKEVKLTQDALEVLSLVAYQQPITKADVDKQLKSNAGNVLRQLLQRQLVVLRRDDPNEVTYQTTPRFLQVFGLTDLGELPQADELSLK